MPDIVVIDPGHGGTANVGGSGWNHAIGPTGLKEKQAAFDVALAAGQRLTNLGHTVRLTREADVNLGLRARAEFARDLQARVFVSIHFNGNNSPAIQGTETFVHLLHLPDSALLANSVQTYVRAATGYNDRGVKKSQLGVLNTAHHHFGTAGCLAEVSFMTDPAEELRLRDAAYIERIGRAIAQGIDDFLGGHSTQPAPIQELPAPTPDGDI